MLREGRCARTRTANPPKESYATNSIGVVLSREYVEMWLANLTAAGDALKEIFAQQAAKA